MIDAQNSSRQAEIREVIVDAARARTSGKNYPHRRST
jgi:hypothetical protein